MKEKIVVINFESEYAHFLAKSIRFLGYYSEIQNPNISLNDLENTKGIIFARKNDENFTSVISEINEQITKDFGKVKKGEYKEGSKIEKNVKDTVEGAKDVANIFVSPVKDVKKFYKKKE